MLPRVRLTALLYSGLSSYFGVVTETAADGDTSEEISPKRMHVDSNGHMREPLLLRYSMNEMNCQYIHGIEPVFFTFAILSPHPPIQEIIKCGG